jgi:hypothetical protein
VEVIKVEKFDGYEVRHEKIMGEETGMGPGYELVMQNAYTPAGHWIGERQIAEYLVGVLGIQPELRCPDADVCTIGYTPRGQRWYGWSHRWISSWGIGDMLFDPDSGDETTPLAQRGVITIETLEQAREAAARFAEYVS